MSARRRQDSRGRELARIHILAEQLGLDRDRYEDVLWTVGRQNSSAKLDEHGRRAVIDHLQAHVDRKTGSHRPNNLGGDRRELKKIEALLADACLPWAYANGMARRMYQRERLEFCHPGQLAGIIAGLEKRALPRLQRELEAELGAAWATSAAKIAALLFDFDFFHRDISRYTEPMSQVLRWLRGKAPAVACDWPAHQDMSRGCGGCHARRHRG